LETIRQYARDRLFESGAGPAARDRHLDFYYDLVIDDTPVGEENVHLSAFSAIGTQKMQEWVERVRAEIDNVRAAVLWAIQSDPLRALAMSDKLPLFFVFEGPALEARQWLEEAIKAVDQLEPAGAEEERRRMALLLQGRTWTGNLQFGEGRHAEAVKTLQAAAEMAQQHNFPGFQAMALSLESLALSFLDQSDAYKVANEALAIQQTEEDPHLQALTLDALIRANMAAGDFTEAKAYYRQAMTLLEEHHTIIGGLMLVSLARLAMQGNNWKEAEELLLKARQGFTDIGSRLFRNMTESEIGHLKRFYGENDAAEAIYRRTIRDWQDLGHQAAVANQLETIAFIAIHRRQIEKAAVLLGAAEAMREHIQVAMLPEERGVYESEVATLRGELGEDRLHRLWEKGRMLDADKAVDFALSAGEHDHV
jgi:tetratricopeptide (TPR) repeat protein